jgi:hypothetical protein
MIRPNSPTNMVRVMSILRVVSSQAGIGNPFG